MTGNRIFGNGGIFSPSLLFRQLCQNYPPITGFIMLFDHGYTHIICNIGKKNDTKNNIR